MDGKTYITEQWKTYHPKNPRKETGARVVNSGIRLFATEQDIDKNLTVDQLVRYKKYRRAGMESNGVILQQVSQHPNTVPEYKISFRGSIEGPYLQKFYDALQKLNYPKVAVSNVAFQVEFSVKKA